MDSKMLQTLKPFYLPNQNFRIGEVLLMTAKSTARQYDRFLIIYLVAGDKNSLLRDSPECTQMFPLVSVQVEPEKLKTLTHDLEALDRAAKRGLK